MTDLPMLLTPSEIADLWRSTARNRARAGREIIARLGLPTVEGHRPGVVLVPRWAVLGVIEARRDPCPMCGGEGVVGGLVAGDDVIDERCHHCKGSGVVGVTS